MRVTDQSLTGPMLAAGSLSGPVLSRNCTEQLGLTCGLTEINNQGLVELLSG